jgi:hypothetical protein
MDDQDRMEGMAKMEGKGAEDTKDYLVLPVQTEY